ncbi:MAG: hypothetical protein GY814_09875 [Gammaproteobacteria bacterium]|nr:hypothetical protein [Gammaproteobacteria bacterium]
MGLGSEFLNILKDTVRLTDAVERLNAASSKLQEEVATIDRRVVRLETMVEIAASQSEKRLPEG